MFSPPLAEPVFLAAVAQAAAQAARAIPPAWPLAASVAVNPFLGQAEETLAEAGARLARVAGAPVTMPRAWYRDKIATGAISEEDLLAAWANAPAASRPADLAALRAEIAVDGPAPRALPGVAVLAAAASGRDWPELIAERFGAWAAGFFDEGQALWAAPRGRSAYADWRAMAMFDLTPEIAGLAGFCRHVAEAPDQPLLAIARAAQRLGLTPEAMETAFHQALMTLGGWGQIARQGQWQAELAGGTGTVLTDMLAIRLIWDEALLERYDGEIGEEWRRVATAHAQTVRPNATLIVDTLLQEAAERSAQRALAATLAGPAPRVGAERCLLQAAFCIDVRSEPLRRALESLDPRIRTLGFAGFFGLGTAHRRFASDTQEARLPVLLQPALQSQAGGQALEPADQAARVRARAWRAWGRFKLAAVSSFAFVEATGPAYAGKLVGAALGWHGGGRGDEPAPRLDPLPELSARIEMAATVLRAMSLTHGFARLVLIAGHGSKVVNNPLAAGLQCGACGGYAGDVNARLLAQLLNDAEVRQGLAAAGIVIPADTLFVAALHDTTTDRMHLFEQDVASQTHRDDLARAKAWLAAAGALTRAERALSLPGARRGADLVARGRDWAQIRPEWALAGCRAFIAAPRARTAGRSLAGRAFLHDYDWTQDRDFSVLELILTAPVVVASWISLQYYGSTVAPEIFGAGNKLLHNVTGGIGVVEGNGGALRTGLAWQSVHDGSAYVHEPLRLTVCAEAPREAMSAILARHAGVRALFDRGWMSLFALDEEGRMAWRHAGSAGWVASGLADPASDASGLAATG